jgi:protein PhnA
MSLRGKFCQKSVNSRLNQFMETKDSNGNILDDGDNVHVTKDLKIKGMSKTLKRGKVIKNIRLTNISNEVECRVGKAQIVLKTQFLKKA